MTSQPSSVPVAARYTFSGQTFKLYDVQDFNDDTIDDEHKLQQSLKQEFFRWQHQQYVF